MENLNYRPPTGQAWLFTSAILLLTTAIPVHQMPHISLTQRGWQLVLNLSVSGYKPQDATALSFQTAASKTLILNCYQAKTTHCYTPCNFAKCLSSMHDFFSCLQTSIDYQLNLEQTTLLSLCFDTSRKRYVQHWTTWIVYSMAFQRLNNTKRLFCANFQSFRDRHRLRRLFPGINMGTVYL